MKTKKVTFADIAAYTHFSKTTISRYFNDPDSLTLENQQKIADALVALDYKENKVGRILASGRTEFVGVIIPNLYMHYYSEMLNQILATYETYGYKFLVFAGNENPGAERRYLEELMAYNIEGLIVLSPTISDILLHINADLPDLVPASGRIRGFVDICRENSLAYELILTDLGNTFKDNCERISAILDQLEQKYPHQKKGIFMPNDTHANILLNLLFRKFGKLPETYRIVGFDNSPISEEAVIPFSTVGQQIPVIAGEAMKLLSSLMEERKKRRPVPLKEPVHKVITPILIRRDTTD